MLKVPDLYTPGGIYWFYKGWNWRCIVALVLGMTPSLPGFFMVLISGTTDDNAAVKIFQLCWFIGAPLSFSIYWTLNKIWTPPGLGVKELLSPESEGTETIDGVVCESDSSTHEKIHETVTTKAVDA